MSARLPMVLVVLVLGLTGCAKIVVGSPVPGAAAAAHPMSAVKELGDYRTVDACSLVDVEGLPTDLAAHSEAIESLDYCSLAVNSAGDDAHAEVGDLVFDDSDSDLGTPEAEPSGLWLYTGAFGQGGCTAYLKFAENIELTSTVYVLEGDGSSALCGAADELARNVSGVLARGPAPHRKLAASSYGNLDACAILQAAPATSVGIVTDPTKYPAHHECYWDSDDAVSVSLSFIVGPPPTAEQDVSTAATIAGRASVLYTNTDDGDGECWIDTGGGAFASAEQDSVDIAEIFVTDKDQTADQACSVGTTMATAVWPKLPPLS